MSKLILGHVDWFMKTLDVEPDMPDLGLTAIFKIEHQQILDMIGPDAEILDIRGRSIRGSRSNIKNTDRNLSGLSDRQLMTMGLFEGAVFNGKLFFQDDRNTICEVKTEEVVWDNFCLRIELNFPAGVVYGKLCNRLVT